MSDIVEVRGVRIGEGIPKIIVPIVEATREEIIRKAESLAGVRKDIVEWRADWFLEAPDPAAVEEVLRELRGALGNTPLLFTFRTLKEGGEKAIEPQDYAALSVTPRPGHADYTAAVKYGGHQDYAGGGHFSGRLTAPLCVFKSILISPPPTCAMLSARALHWRVRPSSV